MQICKDDRAYTCSDLDIVIRGDTKWILFSILEHLSPEGAKSIFEDDAFYFYDEVLNVKSPNALGQMVIGVSITYLADLTCNVILKLTKGDVGDESIV